MEHLVLLATTTAAKVARAVGFSWWGDGAGGGAAETGEVEERGGEEEGEVGDEQAEGEESGEEIRIRLLRGSSTIDHVARTGHTTGTVLRREFGEAEGRSLRLLYLGRVLPPTTTLDAVNARSGSTFHVVRRSAEASQSQSARSSRGHWYSVPDDVPPFDPVVVIFLVLSGILLLYLRVFLDGNLRE